MRYPPVTRRGKAHVRKEAGGQSPEQEGGRPSQILISALSGPAGLALGEQTEVSGW